MNATPQFEQLLDIVPALSPRQRAQEGGLHHRPRTLAAGAAALLPAAGAAPDTLLVTDGHAAYRSFARTANRC